jgi:hypothetical protein
VALLIAQASLIAFGKVAQHRRLGRMGAFYGVLVFGVGLAVSIAAPALRVRSGVLPERFASLVVLYNLVDILCFGGFFAAALVTRRQPELHKRWILSATIALSGAAVGRVIQDPQLYRVVWLSPLVASMLIDLYTRRRLHVVSLVSLCALLVVSFKVAIIAMSPVWAAVGHTILGLFFKGAANLIGPPRVKRTNFPLGLEKKKQLTNFSLDYRRYRFGAGPVSDFVSKRATDLGLHQTLIEAQWCG